MIDRDELELRLVTTLSPMLLALAALSLSALSIVSNTSASFVDEALSVFAVLCVFSAALLIDFVMDKIAMPVSERITYLGGGYPLFCAAVGAMTAFIPVLYEQKNAQNNALAWTAQFIPFVGLGASVFLKMMIYKDRSAFLVAMLLFSCWSLYSAAVH